MTVRFRHIGCTSVVIVYHGEIALVRGTWLRQRDWAWPDGSRMVKSEMPVWRCPDCGERIGLTPQLIEPIAREEVQPTIRTEYPK